MQGRLLGLLLKPLEDKDKGDLLRELPGHFILDLFLCNVPSVVVTALTPLFLGVTEELGEMRQILLLRIV
jgi:hypothetical protein